MAIIPDDWTPRELGTLVFVERDCAPANAHRRREVLLIHKKRGHGAGKVNAPGGRVEPGETPHECAVREVREEVGLRCSDLEPAAQLRFHDTVNGFDMRGFVFLARTFEGNAVETPEAAPFWCAWEAIPYHEMWDDDRYWLPRLRARELVRGDFVFANDALVTHRIELVESGAKRAFVRDFYAVYTG